MTDMLVIGSGPAGLAAAIAGARNGLQVKIYDEFPKPGGRLLGQLHEELGGGWWNGIAEAGKLVDQAVRLGVELELGASVYDLRQTVSGWEVHTSRETGAAPSIVLATGAAEANVPVAGWTLPGVMSIGAAQVMVNVHRVRPGHRGVIIGINVLSLAIARELQLAGVEIVSIVLPALNEATGEAGSPGKVMGSLARLTHLAPSAAVRLGGRLLRSETMQAWALRLYPKHGVNLWGMPIHVRKSAVEIYGDGRVQGVKITDNAADGSIKPGTVRDVPADFVCIAGGLYPLAELAAVAGCPFVYAAELGGSVPLHNERMQTPLKGMYVAGNITGIESAKIAIAQGNVAGLSIVRDRAGSGSPIEQELRQAILHVQAERENALIQFHPFILKGREHVAAEWRKSLK
ncbi:NAD(P)/FAD-dependent oxidoreductase [Paenibacillus humicola]|uniref:NAD(P)/FAD-dependent oxidoreductase n=1 Tax=Paenibacillus humicola TaxID=3110540 RepID=UPI00237AFCE3|nr:FAD-dependent oxidoreductase [Paenibacillus humicola]